MRAAEDDYHYDNHTGWGDEKRGDTWLYIGLVLLLVELYLPFIQGGLDDLRWILFSLTVVVFIAPRLGSLSQPAIRGLLTLFMLNALLRVVSIMWSPDQMYTALRSASLLLMFLFIAVLAAEVVTKNVARAILLILAGWAIVMVGLSALVLFAGWTQLPWNGYPVYRGIAGDRFAGVFGNPNQVGICVAVSFPIIIGLWLEKKSRIYLLVVAALAIYLVIESGSRAGLLAIAAGIAGMMVVLREQSRRFILVMVLLLPVFATVVDTSALERKFAEFASRGKATEVNVDEIAENRLQRWELGWRSIRKHITLGQGYGIGGISDSANPEFTEYDRGYPLHNSFLQVWQENGLVGLVFFMILFIALYWRAFTVSLAGSRAQRPLLAGCMGVIVGGGVSSCFESWLFSVGNLGTMPYWICMGIIWAMTSPEMEGLEDEVEEDYDAEEGFQEQEMQVGRSTHLLQ